MARSNPARPTLLRALNDRSVLELLISSGPCSRADLSRLTGLSKPTIAEVIGRLEESALVRGAGETAGRPGPNGRLYDVAANQPVGAAVSVTAGSARCEVVDIRGRVIGSAASPRSALPRSAAQATKSLLGSACASGRVLVSAVTDVVIGLPGSYDPESDRVRYLDRLPEWTIEHLATSIATALHHHSSVTIDNDVNLALVAERSAAPTRPVVMSLLWLGAGVGLATDMDGSLYRGVSGGAGEIGYIPLTLAAPGRSRTTVVEFQDVVGGAAVARLAREHGISGRRAADAVARAAAASDRASAAFLDELAHRIALGLTIIVAVLDPGVVVLGGDIGRAGGEALASRTSKALRSSGRLSSAVTPSIVTGDPALAGARDVATSLIVERLLNGADSVSAMANATRSTSPHHQPAREALR